jgi:hypothetical protein
MAMSKTLLWIRRSAAILGAALLFAATLPPRTGSAETSRPPPGEARMWIYRIDDLFITQQTPEVRINGRIVAVARLGSRFYRDVPPGNYLITADSQGSAPNQFVRVALAAGQTAYVKVDADNWWASANCETTVVTFYTLVVNPPLAQAEMASLPIGGGG